MSKGAYDRFAEIARTFVWAKKEDEGEVDDFVGSGMEWTEWLADAWVPGMGGCNFYREAEPSGFTIGEFLRLAETAREWFIAEYGADDHTRADQWADEETVWNNVFYWWVHSHEEEAMAYP